MEANLSRNIFRKEIFLLSIEILKWLQKQKTTQSISISPLGLEGLLAIILIGAKTRTYKEIANLLRRSHTTDVPLKFLFETIFATLDQLKRFESNLEVEFKMVTAPTLRVKPQFIDELETLTKIELETGELNLFANDITAEFMRTWLNYNRNMDVNVTLLPQKLVTNFTKAVVINVVNFTGFWQFPFPKNLTHASSFWIAPEISITVAMMQTRAVLPHIDINFINAGAVNIPYQDSSISLMIILPHKRNGLPEVEESLHLLDLKQIKRNMVEEEIMLYLPKFSINSITDFKEFLIFKATTNAFTNKADFSDVFEPIPVPLSNIIQRTHLIIDENGSEPGTEQATEVIFFTPPCFFVNRPFFYFLWDKETGSILALGSVKNLKELMKKNGN